MSVSIVTCVNDKDMYRRNFVEQAFAPKTQLIPIYDAESAAAGLNEGIERATFDTVVCCHQDVRFPAGWVDTLQRQTMEVDDINFGVLGTFGIDMQGGYAGNIKDPHNNPKLGELPCSAQTLDEHCLILRKSSGLRFDEELGGWHMYGADICLQAMIAGLKNYVIDAHLEHLSGGLIDKAFVEIGNAFCNKWRRLDCPLATVVTTCGRFPIKASA